MKEKIKSILNTILFYSTILIVFEIIVFVATLLMICIDSEVNLVDFYFDFRLQSFILLTWIFLTLLINDEK